jgi:hypothetical protein
VQKEMYCKLGAGFDRQDLASSSKDIVDGQVTASLFCTTLLIKTGCICTCITGTTVDVPDL